MEYHAAVEKKEFLPITIALMELETIMLSEIDEYIKIDMQKFHKHYLQKQRRKLKQRRQTVLIRIFLKWVIYEDMYK